LSFTTLFCRNYYVNIPDELIKAARIDGAGFWRIFRKHHTAVSPPILIVTVIWQFTTSWNGIPLRGLSFLRYPPADHRRTDRAQRRGNVGTQYNVESAAVLIAACRRSSSISSAAGISARADASALK